MSKTKKNLTTPTKQQTNQNNNTNSEIESSLINSSVSGFSVNQKQTKRAQQNSITTTTTSTTSIASAANSSNIALVNQQVMKKSKSNKSNAANPSNNNNNNSNKENNSVLMDSSQIEAEFSRALKPIPSFYCININQDGYRNMDRVCHLNEEQIENKNLEFKLRPISGIRNHIKRNLVGNQGSVDLVKETDLLQRIGSVKTLKRLDLSYNNLNSYPRQLCDLILLESIVLTGNHLSENDFPIEWERYQNLIELILDQNELKKIPKSICKSKRLLRLSAKNNNLIDFKNLENFKRLKYLILDNNLLNNLDENLKTLERLEILYLSHNSIQSIPSNLFKSSLTCVKQLDLSFNKLNSICTELFMLPQLESLNLSNNNLNRLPSIPMTYFRTVPIFFVDLSCNQLVRFYDYLLNICRNIDLSMNKIKTIPNKTIQKLSEKQLNSKNLKLEKNPLVEPPAEVCQHGLKSLREYFDEESRHIQINKGFKIVLLGEPNSGKTSLAFALEDLNSQSNLIEQYNVNDFEKNESKLIEIHEFALSAELDSDLDSRQSQLTKKTKSEELNAFSNFMISNTNENLTKKSIVPVSVYDFNGNLEQYSHLSDLFLDKSALIILCVEADFESETIGAANEKNLSKLLDSVLLKMCKNNSFCILPVLTKIDKLSRPNSASVKKSMTLQVENFIRNHINNRLAAIKADLKDIELLPQISASQSDRLKQLVQTQTNLNPDIYKRCIPVSSVKMDGIALLSSTIKEIVYNNKKYFFDVNKKVPAFWTEVQNYACNTLSEMPTTKYVDDRIKIITSSNEPNLSMLCVDYDYYKHKIVEKYGMSHLIDQITKYMNSSGSIIWYQDTEKLKKKVFLRPNVLFDLMFVLFRTNFQENFTDSHKQALRAKLCQSVNLSEENLKLLSDDFLKKGVLNLDLIKILWYPILITDSSYIVQEAITLFADYFHIGYPNLSKEKLKMLFQAYSNKESEANLNDSVYSSFVLNTNRSNTGSVNTTNNQKLNLINFNSVIVPFYLPVLNDPSTVLKIKTDLETDCANSISLAVSLGIKKTKPTCLSRISQKYSFPWGLMSGVFEKFSVNCIINSDLYYKCHYKNFIYAYNEENSIGVMIYTNSTKSTDPGNEVIFEFYLTSYQQVLEGIDTTQKDEFDQTTEMDLDQIWIIALRILQLFEETINQTFPSLRYDRWSLCPQCEKFSFFGEWVTPKELQKAKVKTCPACQKSIHYSFLVRPSTGQSLNLDMKRMQQRLEKLAKFDLNLKNLTSTNQNQNTSKPINDSNSKPRKKNSISS